MEFKVRVRQVIMDPPGQRAPVSAFGVAIGETGNEDAGGSAFVALSIEHVPDVIPGIVCHARRMSALVAEGRDLGGPVSGADGNPSELVLQRLQQFGAEPGASLDRKIGVLRDVRDAVEIGDLRLQEVPQVEVLAEPDAAKLFEAFH